VNAQQLMPLSHISDWSEPPRAQGRSPRTAPPARRALFRQQGLQRPRVSPGFSKAQSRGKSELSNPGGSVGHLSLARVPSRQPYMHVLQHDEFDLPGVPIHMVFGRKRSGDTTLEGSILMAWAGRQAVAPPAIEGYRCAPRRRPEPPTPPY
jgi:hypothetical protein